LEWAVKKVANREFLHFSIYSVFLCLAGSISSCLVLFSLWLLFVESYLSVVMFRVRFGSLVSSSAPMNPCLCLFYVYFQMYTVPVKRGSTPQYKPVRNTK
jgi:hypothetical protein